MSGPQREHVTYSGVGTKTKEQGGEKIVVRGDARVRRGLGI